MTTFEAKGASESAIDDEQRPQDTAAGGEAADDGGTPEHLERECAGRSR